MSTQNQPGPLKPSFNLFDALVVGVLLVGLPLGYWAYSTGKKGLEKNGVGSAATRDIPGPGFARQVFRITLINPAMVKRGFAKLAPGVVVSSRGGQRPGGLIRGATLMGECYKGKRRWREDERYKGKRRRRDEKQDLSFLLLRCPVKVVVDLRCVESDSQIRCLQDSIRIGEEIELVTKFLRFRGGVVDIQRLGAGDEPTEPSDHTLPRGEKAPQRPSTEQ